MNANDDAHEHPTVITEGAIRDLLRVHIGCSATTEHGLGIVEEFWLPETRARADLATIGGELCGYEIKSHADTLRRLPRQVDAYGRVFDRCSLVVAEKHADAARELLPEWWGLVLVKMAGEEPALVEVRPAGQNPAIDPQSLVRLLWRAEVIEALRAHGQEPAVSEGRFGMWMQLLGCATDQSLRATVRQALTDRRDAWVSQAGRTRMSATPPAAQAHS